MHTDPILTPALYPQAGKGASAKPWSHLQGRVHVSDLSNPRLCERIHDRHMLSRGKLLTLGALPLQATQ